MFFSLALARTISISLSWRRSLRLLSTRCRLCHVARLPFFVDEGDILSFLEMCDSVLAELELEDETLEEFLKV